MGINKIVVARGIQWVEIPEAGLTVLCGCPSDAIKHLIKRGLILPQEVKGVACETGPNAILLSDIALQHGEFANLAEFPVLQMLYRQGMIIPDHPNNTGRKPILIGAADQVKAQLGYIHRGNYGLTSCEELIASGVPPEQAAEMMRLKLAFAFGEIQDSEDFLDTCVVDDEVTEIADGVTVRRLQLNLFEFAYRGETVTVNLHLGHGEVYECPYPLGFRPFVPEYFAVIHSGDGDGWDVNRPCMSSIITFQGRIYLIDAGPHLSHTLEALGIGIDQVDGIFHTHAHDDHFAGLSALMRAGRRIGYFASPPVRASAAKKLAALLGTEEDSFHDFFDVHDLKLGAWNDIDGLDVMPQWSPHPVETNIFVFRALWGDGHRTYAHFADIVSLDVLEGMVTTDPTLPGLDMAAFERTRAIYRFPVDLKKIDVGGGMIHGSARDFRDDASARILLAHRAGELTPEEKEIGSSGTFGSMDVLVAGQSDSLRRRTYACLEAILPGVPNHDMRTLINHPFRDINPGAIILKEGATPHEVLMLASGRVEKIRTSSGLFGSLSVGSLIGDSAMLDHRPSRHTYRAASFVRVLCIPPSLYAEVIQRNGLLERMRRGADLRSFLDTTSLFGAGLPADLFRRIVDAATERVIRAGEDIAEDDMQVLNLIRSGRIERTSGRRHLNPLNAGDFFGAEEALLKVPNLAHLRAMADTTVIQIPAKVLHDAPILRWRLLGSYQKQAIRAFHADRAARAE